MSFPMNNINSGGYAPPAFGAGYPPPNAPPAESGGGGGYAPSPQIVSVKIHSTRMYTERNKAHSCLIDVDENYLFSLCVNFSPLHVTPLSMKY